MEIELKSGIEIHQQFDTKKLFCNCPSILRKDEPDYKVERKLHLIAGEEGEVDVAVQFEAGRERNFEYEAYYDNDCLVELDECPPYEINQEALKTALQISLLLNAEIIPYTQIMRKTVIDGSNVSGFQRTVLIAKNGWIEIEEGRIGIQSICLEEDAARIIKAEKDKVVYRLDRLGIPLVEIATAPDIKTGKQAREVALKLGEILRACKVKRGLGTIRQDVNMSISVDGKWGKRIEIKGVQEPALIEKTILTEMKRQEKLVKQGKSEAEVRRAEEDGSTSFLRPLPGRARMYPETDLPLLHISRELINDAKKEMPKLRSEIKDELRKHGLHEEMIKELVQEGKMNEFQELMGVYNKPDLIAKMLTVWIKDLSVKLNKDRKEIEKKLTLDILETILQAIGKTISENEVYDVMGEVAEGKNVKESVKREKVENLEEEVFKLIKEKPGLTVNAYMGLVMQRFKGKVNGKEVAEILKKLLK
ncbi:MAG: Glu-tRNA(Gln) amidotransferase subunit GatE [Nanoarchaeota archaeon]